MQTLKLPKSGKITHIVHISDIHIRVGDAEKSRYNEYLQTFQTFLTQLNQLDPIKNHSAVVVITGDMFEFKNKLDSFSAKLFKYLTTNLAQICPIYIIQGNHDYLQHQPNIPDIISSLMFGDTNSQINYLEKTGHYVAGNVGFGLVSVKETLVSGATSGQVDNLPTFPSADLFPNNVDVKVALFHGTIKNSTLQNYSKSSEGYPIDWFKNYDIGVFGDVHQQQINNSSKNGLWSTDSITWGYPASLIQQNFGESLFGHGYLLWDLIEKKVTQHHIRCPYGMLYVKHIDNHWEGFVNAKTSVDLQQLLSDPDIPQNLIISIKGKSDQHTIDQLKSIIDDNQIKFKILKGILNGKSNDDIQLDPQKILESGVDNIDLTLYNSPAMWSTYIEKNSSKEKLDGVDWNQWITQPESMLITQQQVRPDMYDKIKDRNKKIENLIAKLQDELQFNQFKLKSYLNLSLIKWDWILCYGQNNWVNFQDMNNNICVINGKNDDGKSSFLEIICLGIFGTTIPSRYNKEYSASIICNQKPEGESSYVEIEFFIGDQMYHIRRSYIKKTANKNQIQPKIQQLSKKNTHNGSYEILHEGTSAIDSWVKQNIGNIDGFLMSCMLTQNSDKDFFSLDKHTQVQLFDTSLHLESLNSFTALIKETGHVFKYFGDHYNSMYSYAINHDTPFDIDHLHSLQNQHESLASDLTKLKHSYNSIKESWHQYKESDLALSNQCIQQHINENTTQKCELSYEKLSLEKGALIAEKSQLIELIGPHFKINEKNAVMKTIPLNDMATIPLDELQSQLKTLESFKLTSPPHTLNHCATELNEIYTWLKSNQSIDIQSLIIKKDQLIETLNNITNTHKLHCENIPIKPESSINDYNTFTEKHQSILKSIEKLPYEYNTPEKLLNIKNKIIKPTNDLSKILLMKSQCKNEKISLINQKWYNCPEIEFNAEYQKLLDINTQLSEQVKINQNELTGAEEISNTTLNDIYELTKKRNTLKSSNIKEPKTEYSDVIEKIKNHEINRPFVTKYIQISDGCLKFLNDYNATNDLITQLTSKKNLIATQIEKIQATQIPYNDQCWACKLQSWKVQLDLLNSELSSIDQQLITHNDHLTLLCKNKDYDIVFDEYEAADNWLKKWNQMENELSYWKSQKSLWDQYNKYFSQLQDIENKIDHMQKNHALQRDNLIKTKKVYDITLKKLHESQKYFDSIQFANNNRNKWTLFEEQIAIFDQFQKYDHCCNLYDQYDRLHQKYDYWNQQNDRIKKYQSWESQFQSYNIQIDNLKTQIEDIQSQIQIYENIAIEHQSKSKRKIELDLFITQWNQYHTHVIKINQIKYQINHENLKINQQSFDMLEKYNEKQRLLNYWNGIQNILPTFNQKMSLKSTIEEKDQILRQLEIKINQLNNQYISHQKAQSELLLLGQIVCQLQLKQKAIEHIEETLAGFRKWLYKTIVIPKLLEKTNHIIEGITQIEKYKLNATITNNTRTKDIEFSWFISNGHSNTIIEKSGGFRKFIAALALRIALTCMGASSIQCKQLFIDEGFTAADCDNLDKIPLFINNLLDIYNSVLLVSHLDVIKDCGDINVTISKSTNMLSQLQFGILSQKNQTTKKKALAIPSLNLIKPLQLKNKIHIVNDNDQTSSNHIKENTTCSKILKNKNKCKLKCKPHSIYCNRHS